MESNYSQSKTAVKLKLVQNTPQNEIHLGAAPPAPDLAPGQYLARCTAAWVESAARGRFRVCWQFQLEGGPHDGTGVRKWKFIDASGEVPYGSEYHRSAELALGRALGSGDDLNDPSAIFVGRLFTIKIGYRKTTTPKGGPACEENALRKKDSEDKLRAHEIVSRLE